MARRLLEFIIGDALGEEQSFDPIDMLDPLNCQRAVTADPAAILLLWSRCLNHGAHPIASFVRQQGACCKILFVAGGDITDFGDTTCAKSGPRRFRRGVLASNLSPAQARARPCWLKPPAAALRFENAKRRGGTWPVAYPADKQTDVPLDYGAEFPNPIPNRGTGGYAITLQFPPFDKVTGVTAKLTDGKSNPVQFFLSDPEHPATSFGQFGVICLIPKLSLQAQHTYTVRIDAVWNGKPGSWTWRFSTVSLRAIDASDDQAVSCNRCEVICQHRRNGT